VLLKRYFVPVAAAVAFALGLAGAAMANGHSAKSHHAKRPAAQAGLAHSLIPKFAPHPGAWLRALRNVRPNSAPSHKAKPKAEPRRKPSPKPPRKSRAPKRQPQPHHALKTTTLSIYEHSVQPWILGAQGCAAARRHENGIVVLDFGKPSFKHGDYGTLLFSGRFAANRRITAAMLGYANGYVTCLPKGSTASIELARGTSNYHPSLPSPYGAGVHWARETNRFGRVLARKGLASHVTSAAADDAEPAWDRSFHKTRDFFHGFRKAVHGHTLYDYGSLDGGVGVVWGPKQAAFVAGGFPHTKALPEIYNSAMAREWAELARIARGRYHKAVQFAGVMTQGTPSCDCGLRPPAAHRVLADALEAEGVGHVLLPVGGTNIVG
jgi:hypothetical protein